jgi:hypothetical protein
LKIQPDRAAGLCGAQHQGCGWDRQGGLLQQSCIEEFSFHGVWVLVYHLRIRSGMIAFLGLLRPLVMSEPEPADLSAAEESFMHVRHLC